MFIIITVVLIYLRQEPIDLNAPYVTISRRSIYFENKAVEVPKQSIR
jgi:hypothetical protein